MIKYNLKCNHSHEFESWFLDSNEYEKLNKKNLLECIYCSSNKITKSIMSPMISGKKSQEDTTYLSDQNLFNEKKKLLNLRKYVEKNFEFVGDKLCEKVREVYYDKKTDKRIYGTTTQKEKSELAEEGIELLSIPWVSKDN